MHKYESYKISERESIRSAIKKMDEGGIGFIACLDDNEKVAGIITDGDFRRAVLQGVDLAGAVATISNHDFLFLSADYRHEQALKMFQDPRVEVLPVLQEGKLIEVISRVDFVNAKRASLSLKVEKLDLPVVIMAGGKGTRLDPFTRVLPKPLIPIGRKTIIEIIMDKYADYGMNTFYVSVNHMAKMIKAYFEEFKSSYKINYIEEEQPLGTAGALSLLKGNLNSTFFVSNCDVLLSSDFVQIYNFHKENKNILTLIASMQPYVVPYGICEIEKNGELKKIVEKPVYDLLVSTGVYMCETGVLDYIPEEAVFHMTDLINALKKKGERVGVYPVSQKSWVDIGQWEEYKKAIKDIVPLDGGD